MYYTRKEILKDVKKSWKKILDNNKLNKILFDLNKLSGNIINEESELIPLMTSDDEEAINKEKLPKSLSILPLKNTVLFPGVVIPITATRNKSVKLIKAANKGDKLIGVVSQINNKVSDPKIGDINNIGTVAKILRVLQMPDGNLTIIIPVSYTHLTLPTIYSV